LLFCGKHIRDCSDDKFEEVCYRMGAGYFFVVVSKKKLISPELNATSWDGKCEMSKFDLGKRKKKLSKKF